MGFIMQQLAQAWAVGFIDLKINEVNPEALRLLPEKYARAHSLIPFTLKERQLLVAMLNPRDRHAISDVEQICVRRVHSLSRARECHPAHPAAL